MTDPETYDDYARKQTDNQKIEGTGANTIVHAPCPFCCEPDWLVFRILDMREVASQGATCRHCQRGAKLIFTESAGSIAFEIVQFAGKPVPDYLPTIRGVMMGKPETETRH